MGDAPSPGGPSGGALAIGQLVGKYRVAGVLGRGGMGTVYLAVHEHIGKQAAIKVLDPAHAKNPEIVARFLNEARAVNLVQHPGIVNIFEFGHLEGGAPYITMDRLDGVALSERLRQPMPVPQALRLGRELALALQAAHEKGIVHRDLKPQNVMIVKDPAMPGEERAKLLDFGIAKVTAAPPGEDGHLRTRTGLIMGTPAYMAPEQCRGAGVTDRTDVYALGVLLFQMLAGRLPFVATEMIDLLGQHLHDSPPPLQSLCPFLAPEILVLVHAMLSKEPERRPAMEQVAAELSRLAGAAPVTPGALPLPAAAERTAPTMDHLRPGEATKPLAAPEPPPLARRLLAAGAACLLGLLLALGIWLWPGPRPPRAGASPAPVPAAPAPAPAAMVTPEPQAPRPPAEIRPAPAAPPKKIQKKAALRPRPAPKEAIRLLKP